MTDSKGASRFFPVFPPILCPTCHKIALTAYEIRKHYHCIYCTRKAESTYS